MVEELKKKIGDKKAEVQEGWKRIEEIEKETLESLPKPEDPKREPSPLKRAMTKMRFKKGKDKEGGDWTRVKSNID